LVDNQQTKSLTPKTLKELKAELADFKAKLLIEVNVREKKVDDLIDENEAWGDFKIKECDSMVAKITEIESEQALMFDASLLTEDELSEELDQAWDQALDHIEAKSLLINLDL
jgi:hypothetical protein